MKNIILVLLAIMSSCSSGEIIQAGDFLGGVKLCVVNELGEDLLNPSHPNAIEFDRIEIFYLIDGEEVNAYNEMRVQPKGIRLLSPWGEYDKYYLNLLLNFSNFEKNDGIAYTIIQWDEQDRDTLKAKFSETNSTLSTVKCWVNEVLVWTDNDIFPITLKK